MDILAKVKQIQIHWILILIGKRKEIKLIIKKIIIHSPNKKRKKGDKQDISSINNLKLSDREAIKENNILNKINLNENKENSNEKKNNKNNRRNKKSKSAKKGINNNNILINKLIVLKKSKKKKGKKKYK